MTAAGQSRKLTENRLLALLPAAEYARLSPQLKPVRLTKKTLLYQAGDRIQYCYFPVSGVICLLSSASEEKNVEVGMVGKEGMIGVSVLLQTGAAPYDVVVQNESEALQIDARVLTAEFSRGGKLHAVSLCYIHLLICQIAQSAACHQFHTVEERLARWLLMTKDRLESDSFPLTQDFIASVLGVPRTNVTMTAGGLQERGLINYKRGIIIITDDKGLEEAACDCYRIVKKATEEILK